MAGDKNKNVVGLCADLTESTQMNLFRDKYPDRFIEIGVAEQNLASVASGIAAMGKIPAMTSYAMFSPGRNWEQIRTTICYNDRKVIIAGSHAGISVGPDGGTHQAIEDLALMRVIPNMTVISPCDVIEARKATVAAFESTQKSPVYIRLAREKTPIITTEETSFVIGKANVLYQTENVENFDTLICATGALVYNALLAAKELETKHNQKVAVINFHTIKPLDTETLFTFVEKSEKIVTVEEHQIAGGFGSAICEAVSDKYAKIIHRIGVQDHFGQSGTPTELIKFYKMDVVDIVKASL
ncbi:transketolase family protein [Arenimonas sp.]|nr:transketolase family protein [Candidatus Parcubacteria bacterium]